MTATAQPAVDEQRQALVAKVEQAVTHKANLNGKALILHFRVLLQDLPFAGQPSLLLDEHRAAIEKLVDRASREDVKIFSITGHTSEPGTDQYNENLSLMRAQAVFTHLQQTVEGHQDFSDNSLYAQIKVRGQGESQPTAPTTDESDQPLNRRVEISYRMKIVFPQPPGADVPRSRYWKVDFAAGGGTGTGTGEKSDFAIGVEFGVGTLTMLPDDETGQAQSIQKSLSYESLGVSVGLASIVKKLKFIARFPKIKKLIDLLDDESVGNYTKTANLLENTGFAVDAVSGGGEFMTEEPLSFAEMSIFNFSLVAGNLSLGANAGGSMILLHSPNFFTWTIIYGAGVKIALPDAALDFVPAARVQVNV